MIQNETHLLHEQPQRQWHWSTQWNKGASSLHSVSLSNRITSLLLLFPLRLWRRTRRLARQLCLMRTRTVDQLHVRMIDFISSFRCSLVFLQIASLIIRLFLNRWMWSSIVENEFIPMFSDDMPISLQSVSYSHSWSSQDCSRLDRELVRAG